VAEKKGAFAWECLFLRGVSNMPYGRTKKEFYESSFSRDVL